MAYVNQAFDEGQKLISLHFKDFGALAEFSCSNTIPCVQYFIRGGHRIHVKLQTYPNDSVALKIFVRVLRMNPPRYFFTRSSVSHRCSPYGPSILRTKVLSPTRHTSTSFQILGTMRI